MSYSNKNGKYQKAYEFLFNKLVPASGSARNELGEALRMVVKVLARSYNDGDSYDDCIELGVVNDLSKKMYPFDKEYNELGKELDHLLSGRDYDKAIDLVLVHIMLSLSSTSNIYNPNTNRLVPMDSVAGKNAFKLLDLNSIFINYCGKNEKWLPESLRKEGVKISKSLSEETRKELKCDTIQEFYREHKFRTGTTKTVKVTLSKDNSILSKKFSKINKEHKKSIREYKRKLKLLTKKRELRDKKRARDKIKNFDKTVLFYEELKDLTVNKRIEVLKKLRISKATQNSLVKMFLVTLLEYKEKKVTSKSQREHKKEVMEKLVKKINKSASEILKILKSKADSYGKDESLYSYNLTLPDDLDDEMEKMLIEILGGTEAYDNLYLSCCR